MLDKENISAPSIRILIVDDEEVSLFTLKSHLKRHGYDVICAANGQEALALRGCKIDCVSG